MPKRLFRPKRGGLRYQQYKRQRLMLQNRMGTPVSGRRARSVALRNMRTGGLLGIERKFLDVPFGATALTAPTNSAGGEIPPSGVVTGCYTAPALGDGPTNRDGNKIVVTSLTCKGVVTVAAQATQATADISGDVFICLVKDKQTNGAQLNSEDVFTNPIAVAPSATNVFRNMSYMSRFQILAVKKKALRIPSLANDTGATGGIIQSGFHTPFTLKWRGKMPVTFTTGSTTADIANVTDNSIQMVAFCSNADLAPNIQGNVRTRFVG